jgi:excisionase family DNA binding protein
MVRGALAYVLGEEPVSATREETRDVLLIQKLLKNEKQGPPALCTPEGATIALPDSVYRVLTAVLKEMAQGNAVAVVPIHHELTTQEAADLLDVSRPFLVQILEQGHIAFHKTGTHRRIRFQDLMEYRRRRDESRSAALDELAREDARLGI